MSMLLKIFLLMVYARSEGIEEPLQIFICLWEIGFIIVSVDMAQDNTQGAQWLSGRALDSRPRGRGFEPHPASVLCPWARHFTFRLSTGSSRKTRPYITERLLMGRKELNLKKKKDNILWILIMLILRVLTL